MFTVYRLMFTVYGLLFIVYIFASSPTPPLKGRGVPLQKSFPLGEDLGEAILGRNLGEAAFFGLRQLGEHKAVVVYGLDEACGVL